MFCVEIALGHCNARNESLPQNQIEVAELIGLYILTDLFGGCQLVFGIGTFAGADGGEPTIETCSILKACSQEEFGEDSLEQLEALASTLAEFLHQRCVYLSVQQHAKWVLRFVRPRNESSRQKEHPAA